MAPLNMHFARVFTIAIATLTTISVTAHTHNFSTPLTVGAPRGPIAIVGKQDPNPISGLLVSSQDEADRVRLAALDAYWATVSRAVRSGDFDAYAATCHLDGVLVIGSKKTSQPLATALKRWKREFDDTRDGKMQASVEFRLSSRTGDATTAYETGIFLYISQVAGGPLKKDYVFLEALLVKQADGWKILMEHQKGPATEAQWEALRK